MKNKLVLKIGFSDSNDITLPHESVSALHAYLKKLDDEKFELQDAGSTNGIHVNNRRVKSKIVDAKDQIIIGGFEIDTAKILARANKIILEKRTDFTAEYKEIIDRLKEYNRRRDQMSESNKWINIVRIGISALLILVLFFKPELIPDTTVRYVLILAISSIPLVAGMFAEKGEKKRAKLEMLKLQYEDDIRCPKCRISLLRHTPQYLLHRKKCPNDKCNVTYAIE